MPIQHSAVTIRAGTAPAWRSYCQNSETPSGATWLTIWNRRAGGADHRSGWAASPVLPVISA